MNEDEASNILHCIATNGADKRLIRAVVEALVIDATADVRPVVRWVRAARAAVEPQEQLDEPEVDEDPPGPVIEPEDDDDDVIEIPPAATNGHGPRLEDDTVQHIRRLHWTDALSYRKVSERTGVNMATVGNVCKRRVYKTLPLVPGEPGYVDEVEAREARIQARRDRAADATLPGVGSSDF